MEMKALVVMAGIALTGLVLCSGCSGSSLSSPVPGRSEGLELAHDSKSSSPGPGARAASVPTLQIRVRMVYPRETGTVGDAVSYMLEPHAYRPAYPGAGDAAIAERTFINNYETAPVPLYLALQRLMGKDGQIVLDQKKRLYAFRTRRLGEASVTFADLTAAGVRSADYAGGAQGGGRHASTGNQAESLQVLRVARPGAERGAQDDGSADSPVACRVVQFRSKAMLSRIVQDYFSKCGFDEIFWELGEPGRYTDYQVLHDADVPLPGRHEDLIELLHTRFGIKTRIHDDNRIYFYDEESLL